MPRPELTPIAEGELASGERWVLRAGGSARDYYTLLETVHPDGGRDSGGMGGPLLSPGRVMNVYTGTSDRGLRRVIVRADRHAAVLRLETTDGGRADLRPAAVRPELGLTFFAVLLPGHVEPVSLTALDGDGRVLESRGYDHGAEFGRFL